MSSKTLITKYFLLIKYIELHPYAKKKEMLDYFAEQLPLRGIFETVSGRTFTRYLQDIRNQFDISIEHCPHNKGYYIPTDEKSNEFIVNILEDFMLLNMLTNRGIKDTFIYPEKRRSRGIEHFVPLRQAIQKQTVVRLEYNKYFPEVSEIREIEPYALKESRGRWYLLGFDKGVPQPAKSFGLDRISTVTVTNEGFVKHSDIDWNKKYEHCFAMFTNDNSEPEKVVLSFDHRDGNYIESMPLHSSQKLRREGERTIVELHIKITLDFIMELMSRSWSIEVIEPKSLRAKLHVIYVEAEVRNR
ncbi:MAG: WYL domain-containing protein [Salinivirgaceae bacterium]|nr:WYL domain-containing protein [Salinivirgaceae bacterium]